MRHFNLFFSIAIFTAGSIAAQPPLTIEQCRAMALENNKQMVIAMAQREKAGYEVKAYRTNYLPKLSATGNYLLTTASMEKIIPPVYLPTYVPDAGGQLVPNILTSVDGVPLFKEYAFFPGMELQLKPNASYIAGLCLEQPIYTGGKITSVYRMSQLGERMAQLNEAKTRAEVILQTDEAFWSYIRVCELEKTAAAYREMVLQLQADVNNAFQAGMVPRNDLLRVQVKLNEAELQLMKAVNGVQLAGMQLCHVVGLPLNTVIITEPLPENSTDEALPLPDLTSRPEYALLADQVEFKEQQLQLVRSEFLPQVGIAGNLGYANGLKLNGTKLLDRTAFSAVVSVQIPLFHWGEGRHKVRSAMVEKKMAALQQDELTGKMELELQQALQAYEEANASVELTGRSLEQAEENLRECRDRYEAGLETLPALLEAQAMWQQAQSEQIQARSDSRLAATRYLKASGRL